MLSFGFSFLGLIYLFALIIPNILWTKHLPKNYQSNHENKIFGFFEKVGQALVCTILLFFNKDFFPIFSVWYCFLFLSIFFMILYELWWVRYFKSEHNLVDFYSSFLKIPVAGASLPILGFLCLGIYTSNLVLIGSTIILGIGHIGIHLEHLNELKK